MSYHCSQMYAVFILWPVPAENCIFFKFFFFLKVFGQYETLHHPFSLIRVHRWITVAVLRAHKQRDILKSDRQTNVQSLGPGSILENGQTNPKVGVMC